MAKASPTENRNDGHLKRTPLDKFNRELGAKMAAFAGFELPLSFEGVIVEHVATRTSAGLFDISHMGIVDLLPAKGHDLGIAAERLEKISPISITDLRLERMRYGLLTNDEGGVVDDLIISRHDDRLRLVLNAAQTEEDLNYIQQRTSNLAKVEVRGDLAQLALQGPKSSEVLSQFSDKIDDLNFMQRHEFQIDGIDCDVSRSGYTGEDGFELIVPATSVERLADKLLQDERVVPCGLGARDSLRLEAGLCLYGHELTARTTPIEAGLAWTIQQRRRVDAAFAGAQIILRQLSSGPTRTRVGISALTRRPIRDGAELKSTEDVAVGTVTSGGFGPTCERPVAMGYVQTEFADAGTSLIADVRGKEVPCEVTTLPFVPHRYQRN
jgi:aminomethyltransferase